MRERRLPVDGIPDDEFDEARLEPQPGASSRLDDRKPKPRLGEGAEGVQAARHVGADVRECDRTIEEIRPQCQYECATESERLFEQSAGRLDLRFVELEDRLRLVDDHDLGRTEVVEGSAQRIHERRPAAQDLHPAAALAFPGNDPGEHEGGLARSRGADNCEDRSGMDAAEDRLDHVLPTEEVIGVVGTERRQPAVRAQIARG